ncbi:hypothetical protein [Shewanella mangrovi]|uniref:hypothetical protein n=1 Tax=Shewanella mangrovi TaxID=1515746 RepID=UPI0006912974|nr:hypothetical protein [Shewanella mangrovi]
MDSSSSYFCRSLATIQFGIARSDGHLSVNGDDLTFEPLNKQVGLGPYHLRRQDISHVRRDISRAEQLRDIDIERLEVELRNGEIYRFIINDSAKWLELLQPQTASVD